MLVVRQSQIDVQHSLQYQTPLLIRLLHLLNMINSNNESDVFVDYDPKLFQHLINQLREEAFKNISSSGLSSDKERNSFQTMLTDLNIFITITTTTTSTTTTTKTTTTTTSNHE